MFRNFIKKSIYYFLNAAYTKNGVSVSGQVRGLQNVDFEGKNAIADRCNFSGNIKIGYATTLGYNNFVHGNISIGKYCQIGVDVAIHATNHPTNYLSTYINKNLFNGELKSLKTESNIIIGNDVWIGHNALIIGNVKIGNGSVIGAGSVVTKDVEPYSIVVGSPAKKINMRFSDNIISEVEGLKWWDMQTSELEKIKHLFFKNFKNEDSIF